MGWRQERCEGREGVAGDHRPRKQRGWSFRPCILISSPALVGADPVLLQATGRSTQLTEPRDSSAVDSTPFASACCRTARS